MLSLKRNLPKVKYCFEVRFSSDSPITTSMSQPLIRLPRIRARLAQAMASSQHSKRGTKPVSPVKYTIAAVMLSWSLKVEIISHENRASEILCLYIELWVVEEFIAET